LRQLYSRPDVATPSSFSPAASGRLAGWRSCTSTAFCNVRQLDGALGRRHHVIARPPERPVQCADDENNVVASRNVTRLQRVGRVFFSDASTAETHPSPRQFEHSSRNVKLREATHRFCVKDCVDFFSSMSHLESKVPQFTYLTVGSIAYCRMDITFLRSLFGKSKRTYTR